MTKKSAYMAQLLDKFKRGTCSRDELIIIQAWLARPENEKEAAEIISKDFQQAVDTNEEGRNRKIKDRLWNSIEQQISLLQSTSGLRKNKVFDLNKSSRKHLWRVAAVIIFPLIAFAGTISYFVYFGNPLDTENAVTAGQLYESGTKAGQKKNIRLADGSLVRLNARSTIRFNEDFISQPSREVYLEGEAYFDVVKNGKPFIIKTRRSEVRVLGTSFNVNDFSGNDQLRVAVNSGEVSVNFPGQAGLLLRPGKMAVYDQQGNISTIEKIEDMEVEFGWKDDILLFKDASFEEILDRLSDWFGVQFQLQEGFYPSRKNFSARFENESLKTVMEGISHAGGFSYKIDQSKVWIGNRENP